jgi:hypothetical protein
MTAPPPVGKLFAFVISAVPDPQPEPNPELTVAVSRETLIEAYIALRLRWAETSFDANNQLAGDPEAAERATRVGAALSHVMHLLGDPLEDPSIEAACLHDAEVARRAWLADAARSAFVQSGKEDRT